MGNDHRGTEINRIEDNNDSSNSLSESEMLAARAFKRPPQSTTSEDNNMIRRIIDSDQEEFRNDRGESVMIGKNGAIVNRANRE